MAHIDKNKKLRPSVLDRLLDNEPHIQTEVDKDRNQKLVQLRDSVRRDLETLLNTRCRVMQPPEELGQLEHSLLNYGLPDLATVNVLNAQRKKEFTQDLEKLLRDFEPRFKSVKVKFTDNKDKTDRTIRFRIDATLYADPYPEMVIFDSVLEPITRTVNVEQAR